MQGLKLNNVTSITLVNATTKTVDLSPGAGKRWLILTARQFNVDDVNRNCSAIKYAEAAATNVINQLITGNSLAQNGSQQYPSSNHAGINESANHVLNQYLEGDEIMRWTWTSGGASTGGTDADGLSMEVLEQVIS